MKKKRHVNIPIFVPHIGCPHDCAFCNQKVITGKTSFDISSIDIEVEKNLEYISSDVLPEIAFFGGNFTGIEKSLMISLLEKATQYVNMGKVSSIRLSTRPDYISSEILDILSRYPVKTIELGIQSTSESVLKASMRGHTLEDTVRACSLVREHGFDLVGQMMLALPLSTLDSEIKTAEFIVSSGAVASRIYPTVVFSGTGLDTMMKKGEYIPISVEEAARRSAIIYKIFADNSVKVLRIGLCESDGLRSSEVCGGAYHAALGEMALSEYYSLLIEEKISAHIDALSDISDKEIIITIPKNTLSAVIGQKGSARKKLYEKYSPSRIFYIEDESLGDNEVQIKIKEHNKCD